ncbi:hypothetical protein [Chamaesiphon minutus]|uniref:Uncharacterized protein n=1 Tax=Chamaesiphon minutus (strain ATCC 27169 / PCC 6605) TaxID=1173020 RepID=K9UP00_CHAP6|nr:hypothetical protein [Chamaesiphon minutus]AFY96166.1 hypothetical protein Cha6605_5278 [Chamaesiphon minutus PCC 6605]
MISEKSTTSNMFDLDDERLIEKFIQGSNQLLASPNLRLEVTGGVSQLLARNGDPIAIMYLQSKPRTLIVKHGSPFLELIDRMSIERDFVMFGDASRPGFIEYRHYVTPAGYRIWYTDPSILWKKWWPTERFQDKQRFNMNILVSFKSSWYPVQNINVNAGTFTIKTIAGQLVLKRDDKVLWLAQVMQESLRNTTDIHQSKPTPKSSESLTVIDELNRHASTELSEKIQSKTSTIEPENAWPMIKQLEEKLQAQIKLNSELEEKFDRSESRATIAEQRLQIVYKYLQDSGIDPREIYKGRKTTTIN